MDSHRKGSIILLTGYPVWLPFSRRFIFCSQIHFYAFSMNALEAKLRARKLCSMHVNLHVHMVQALLNFNIRYILIYKTVIKQLIILAPNWKTENLSTFPLRPPSDCGRACPRSVWQIALKSLYEIKIAKIALELYDDNMMNGTDCLIRHPPELMVWCLWGEFNVNWTDCTLHLATKLK